MAVPSLVYVLLTCILLGGVLRHPMSTSYPNVSRDNYADFWNLWWFQSALRSGHGPFFTPLLYFPTGTSLRFTEFGPLYGLGSVPLFLIENSERTAVLAHNLWVAATFVLTGLAVFAFARAESRSQAGALLAGGLIAFSAFRIHHLEHLNLLSFYWIPLTALAARGCVAREPGRSPNLLLGSMWMLLCGIGAAASSLTILSFTGLFLVTWMLLQGFWNRSRIRWKRVPLAGIMFALGALPILGDVAGLGVRGDATTAASHGELVRYSPDLVGFVAAQQSALFAPLWRGLELHGAGGRNMYLGLVLVVLAALGIRSRGKSGFPLAATAVIWFLASWGPGIWILDKHHDLPFSMYEVFQALGPLKSNRVPERCVLMTLVALAPLAASGFQFLLDRPRLRMGAFVSVALAGLELCPRPVRAVQVDMPEVYHRLRNDPVPGAIMEMSVEGKYANDFAFHQIAHRRPLVLGPLTRISGEAAAFADQARLEDRLKDPRAFVSALRDLQDLGVAYLVWHREGWEPAAWDIVTRQYAKEATIWFESDDLIVYRLQNSKP